MDERLKESKQTLRSFMREHYTDERLAWLLAHARAGKLGYSSCCCFIGIPTADHALQEAPGLVALEDAGVNTHHYDLAKRRFRGALAAEKAFLDLGYRPEEYRGGDEARRVRRLIPIVKAEVRRRGRTTTPAEQFEVVSA